MTEQCHIKGERKTVFMEINVNTSLLQIIMADLIEKAAYIENTYCYKVLWSHQPQ